MNENFFGQTAAYVSSPYRAEASCQVSSKSLGWFSGKTVYQPMDNTKPDLNSTTVTAWLLDFLTSRLLHYLTCSLISLWTTTQKSSQWSQWLSHLSDLRYLSDLSNLSDLNDLSDLSYLSDLSDFSDLTDLSDLKSPRLSQWSQLSQWSPISSRSNRPNSRKWPKTSF